MNQEYQIGCSGYYYPAWKDKFYPRGLQPREWLHYYSTIFNTVELNGTFYRTPKLADLIKYRNATQDNFSFSVKMNRYITHILKLKDSTQSILDFQDLMREGLAGKLSYFLFQMPPSFQYNEEHLRRIVHFVPNEPQNVVELRHPSWWNETAEKALRNARITFCNVDFPGMASHFIHTSSHFYLRLHGNPELFKSSYDAESLRRFYKEFPSAAGTYNIYFNNTYYEAGYTNARQLMEIVKSKAIF